LNLAHSGADGKQQGSVEVCFKTPNNRGTE